MSHPTPSWPHLYLAVALTTLATLLLELSLTRVFSVVFYYHFAFLAISIALFGLGAGGVFSYAMAARRDRFAARLGWLSAGNGLLVVVSLAAVLGQHGELSNLRLAFIYFTSALPFFVSGIVVSTAIAETVERVHRVYFFDLLGAAAGCLLLVPLLNQLGGPNTVIAAGVLFAAAGAVWHHMAGSGPGRAATVALALALVLLAALNIKLKVLDVKYAKGQKLEKEVMVRWNSFSRIAVAPERESGIPLIFIDADASTGIANFDFDRLTERERRDLLWQGPGLPYGIRPGAKTLIIGPGGGWDVARALAGGSRDVTGVEINPLIGHVIMGERFSELGKHFPALIHNVFTRPEVRLHVEEGRSFIRRSREKYQVLQATLVDTWASTAAGAFALSENNLYTIEAFQDYLSHLTGDGLLAFTRWGFDPPRESLRLVSLAIEALARLGEREPWRHVIVAREGSVQGWGARDTVIFSRKPLSDGDLARARQVIEAGRMEAVYLPDEPGDSPFAQLLMAPDPAAFRARYPFDISPVSDNRPFFFYTVQPRDVLEFLRSASTLSADYKINRAVPLLFGLLLTSLLATLVILALPPLVLRTRLPRDRHTLAFLAYFLLVGIGYILVEIALIQRFVLFLGHPTYALTVVIFSMLVSSGLGSAYSRRLLREQDARLVAALAGVCGLVAVLAAVTGPLFTTAVGLPLPWKIVIAVVLLFPPGFLMGMPFPAGLARLTHMHEPSVRWAWSLNAAASVLGSVLAMALAIFLGLLQTLLIGAGAYLLAIVLLRASRTGPAAAHA
jgi:hypothetical protein